MSEVPEETTYGDYQVAAESTERRFKKPMIHKAKPADSYAMPGEAIYEFNDGHSGGLISLARNSDDKLVVDVYRTDDDVTVRATSQPDGWRNRARAFLERHDQQEKHWDDVYEEGNGPDGDMTSNEYEARESERADRLSEAIAFLREVTQ